MNNYELNIDFVLLFSLFLNKHIMYTQLYRRMNKKKENW